MVIILFASFVLSLALVRGIPEEKNVTWCTSKICDDIGNEILTSIDKTIKPCDDFYLHACGKWIENHSKNMVVSSQFLYLGRKTEKQLKELLDAHVSLNDNEVVKKAKKYYRSCLDLDTMNKRGLGPLARILRDNGEWPLTVPFDEWNPENFIWSEIHEKLAKATGVSALFDFKVRPDPQNSNTNVLHLVPPHFNVHHHFKDVRGKQRSLNHSAYRIYITKVAQAFVKFRGAKVDNATIDRDLEKTIFFERHIETLWENAKSDADYRYTTIEELQKTWDRIVRIRASDYSINWVNLIRDRLKKTGVTIASDDRIVLNPGNYFEILAESFMQLATWNDHPIRIIVNYIHWKSVDSLIEATTNDMRKTITDFLELHSQNLISHHERCVLSHQMNEALLYIYVRNKMDKKSRDYVLEMAAQVTEALKMEINEAMWMTEDAKNIAIKIINEKKELIAYPDWYDDEQTINAYYRKLTVGSKYFENVIASRLFKIRREYMKLRKSRAQNKIDWLSEPTSAEPVYLDKSNALIIPAGVLQMPVFHLEKPEVMNFGGIGTILGHLTSYALGTTGLLYDRWVEKQHEWVNNTIENHKKRANCFFDQYKNHVLAYDIFNNNAITVGDVNDVDGFIAEISGLKAALRAYKIFKNHSKINTMIPSLKNFTDEQLFFYSTANVLCDYRKPSYWPKWANGYSPAYPRIISTFSNMKEFSDAFNCPAEALMNPRKKCVLWN